MHIGGLIRGFIKGASQQEGVGTKRLLLNDPDVTSARLAALEQIVKKLQIDSAQDKNDLLQLKTELAQEKNTVLQLKRTVVQLQAELAKEKINLSLIQTGLAQDSTNLSKIETRIQNLGSTYVRWGRKQCSGVNTDMVYSGFTSGQPHYFSSHIYSGPANLLCLPNIPNVSNRTSPENSLLFGTEYQDGNYFAKGAQDEDVPCALCRSKDTVSTVMIPGRDTCYSGWKTEYQGILASGGINERPSSYICLDGHPEFLQGGERNDDQSRLLATRTQCGSLPCPLYVNNMDVNCVVCSK